MANAHLRPLDSEQFQFVVDVMKHLIRIRYPSLLPQFVKTDVVMAVEGFRSVVKEHFAGNISKVVEEIDSVQTTAVARDFSAIKTKDLSSLEKYINKFKSDNFPQGFDAGRFLVFSVHVCLISLLFEESGTDDALLLAVRLIEISFPEKDENLIWKEMNNIDKKYKKDSLSKVAPAFYRREILDGVSSGTDESSNSSTTTTESGSASGSQNLTAASSAESLNELIMKLNASTVKSAGSAEIQGNVSSVPSNESANIIDDKGSGSASTAVCTITFETIQNAISAAFASTEDPDEVGGKEKESISCTDSSDNSENKASVGSLVSSTSSPKSFKCVVSEDKESSSDVLKVEEKPSVSSSTSKTPTDEDDSGTKLSTLEVDSQQRTPVKSPKSFLGKRPSPRAGIALRGVADDSETEIKKPKLESTEKKDEE